ncbi:ATP-dependent RNA helicase Cdc28 [Schizosaccharomyces japonicus yFS275]|uniref:RNA helicase n=1 Tax=Schizosaccharomyces japonicus (strain yFS275 / FY16936) TaxID=402676 RepID=B6K0C1_SCHJY|nr:ATP-dependent RNA helicase Cdc28 [Schizosaccharomyces japonicus yFS275]EEB06271.2 ATP-dependent RNA helicase Cdc28 [Schizosaccharomyces japonicus yFS275]
MSLQAFVSDKIMSLLGMSEPSVAEYIIAEASSSSDASSLYKKLVDFGMSGSDVAVSNFAKELFHRVPHKTSNRSADDYKARKKRERDLRQAQMLNSSYKLLEEEPDEVSTHLTKRIKKRRPEESSNARNRVRRNRDGREWESDDEEYEETASSHSHTREHDDRAGSERSRSQFTRASLDEIDEGDGERDVQERADFEERLRKRDVEREAQKFVEDHSSKLSAEQQSLKKIVDDPDALREAIPELRKVSRRNYLKLREQQRLEILRREIQDEEKLFAGERLTKREIQELERKKELLRLAEERMKLSASTDEYQMPEDYFTEKGKLDLKRKEAVLYQRYQEREDNEKAYQSGKNETELDEWERYQINKGVLPGTSTEPAVASEEYDFVFDESQQIDFMLDERLPPEGQQVSPEELARKMQEAQRQTLQETRKSLPIYQHRDGLLQAIEEYQVLIVVAETGSGKTTQLPQYLHEAGYTNGGKKICCTQPRRVAAMSVAARVAKEMNVRLGQEVGYTIRFENNTSEKTCIKYLTDGMLLREFLTEPDLESYSVIIIDEAHERTLHTDILFGLVKDIARFRPDLKLLISSATIDAEKFSTYFDNAPIYNVPGRRYPVSIYYTPQPEANYIQAAITTVLQIHTTQESGDILVFLTGQDEIELMSENLQELCRVLGKKIKEMIICPIYANLPSELQSKIFEPTPPGARKVVLATNIAETSITIDGVSFVIDPGFVKEDVYNPRTGMQSLVTVPCSRASADQRAGRAGRVGPGKCFRLYTRWTYNNELEASTSPEIQRTNLTSIVLLLKSLGINNLLEFDFMDAPPPETLMRSLELLYALGALNSKGELTKLGRQIAEFPADPMLSKSLIAASMYGCVEEVLSVVAMLGESSSLFYRPRDKVMEADKCRANFTQPLGDHFTLLHIWNEWVDTDFSYSWARENFLQYRSLCRARDVRDQLASLCDRVEIEIVGNGLDSFEPIQKALLAGYFCNAARLERTGDSYRTIKTGQTVFIHPSSTMLEKRPKFIIYYELVLTSKEYCRQVMEIQPEWLLEISPHYFKPENIQDSRKGMPRKK